MNFFLLWTCVSYNNKYKVTFALKYIITKHTCALVTLRHNEAGNSVVTTIQELEQGS